MHDKYNINISTVNSDQQDDLITSPMLFVDIGKLEGEWQQWMVEVLLITV